MATLTLFLHGKGPFFTINNEIECKGKKYVIGDRIANGGNAVVHDCMDKLSGDIYAIKLQLKHEPKRLKRFRQEQQLHSKLSHAHLVNYICHGNVKASKKIHQNRTITIDIPFVIMEKCECTLLDAIKNKSDPFIYSEYIAQFRGLSSALSLLHSHAIHRDIKPSNILIIGDRWVLSDFGLCLLNMETKDKGISDDGEKIGPANWMSPEANDIYVGFKAEITSQSDVFQLASVFWTVVNHKHPTGIIQFEDWSGPENLFTPLFNCLQHNPTRRPANGAELHKLVVEAIEASE